MRAAQFFLWLALAIVLVLPLLRRRRLPRPPTPPTPHDELVKDPVCQTYVVRSRAVSLSASSGPKYFCSAECARRYGARA